MRLHKIRYIVHPDDQNHPFFSNRASDEFQEIVAQIEMENNRESIEQIHDRLTVRLKNKGYVRYIVHPDDEVNLCLDVDKKFQEIRILFDENEADQKPYISQVNNYATVPDDSISSSVYGEIEIKR